MLKLKNIILFNCEVKYDKRLKGIYYPDINDIYDYDIEIIYIVSNDKVMCGCILMKMFYRFTYNFNKNIMEWKYSPGHESVFTKYELLYTCSV